MKSLVGMGAVRDVLNKLKYIVENEIHPAEAKGHLLDAIDEIVSLRKQISDPRYITITRDRHQELIALERLAQIRAVKIRHLEKELNSESRPKTVRQHSNF